MDLKKNSNNGDALSGWVVNVTSIVERVPLSQYAPKTKEQVFQILVSILVLMISGSGFSRNSRNTDESEKDGGIF